MMVAQSLAAMNAARKKLFRATWVGAHLLPIFRATMGHEVGHNKVEKGGKIGVKVHQVWHIVIGFVAIRCDLDDRRLSTEHQT